MSGTGHRAILRLLHEGGVGQYLLEFVHTPARSAQRAVAGQAVHMNLKIHLSAPTEIAARFLKKFAPALMVGTFLALTTNVYGINASPRPIQLTQPDGTRITLRPKGDEFAHWFEDTEGFSVVRDQNRRYVYAQRRADGGLGPTASLVGRANPRALGIEQRLRPSPQFIQAKRQRMHGQTLQGNIAGAAGTSPRRVNPVGTVRNLVILCRFSDHTLGVHTRAREDYDTLMNSATTNALVPTGSLKEYYREASYGTLTFESTVVAWITLPQTEAYYADGQTGFGIYPQNAQRMVEDALTAVDPIVDFAQFDQDNDGWIDAIDIIHSGYGAETGFGHDDWIWSHKWNLAAIPGRQFTSNDRNANNTSVKVFDYHTEPALWGESGTNIARVGVFAHETGHFFGLPDLYDTDYSSEGIGSWCLMANSWGFDGEQLHPGHPSAWAKVELGWVAPTNISPGTHNLPRVATTRSIHKITNGFPPGEYLLLENRQRFGFDGQPTGGVGGMAIWHIDEDQLDNDGEGYPGLLSWPGSHYRVALVQADGAFHLERGINGGDSGDLFRSGGVSFVHGTTVPSTHAYQTGVLVPTANVITNISITGSNMTYVFINTNAVVPPPPGPNIVVVDANLATENYTPTNRSMDPGEHVSVTLRLRNTGATNANVTATLLPNGGVITPSGAQVFTLNTNGAIVGKTFTFIAGGPCGSMVTNRFQLQMGGSNIATPLFNFSMGSLITRLVQNFDTVTAPALPLNWDGAGAWMTVPGTFHTPSNSAFIINPGLVSDASLTSPQFNVASTNAQLSFIHRYATEYGFDGGVLELSLNGGPFTDILAAGGRFGMNGYNYFLDNSFGNPLAGREAWTGTSTNFLTTTVILPATAAGKSARLRWRFGSDGTLGATGWYVDTILFTERGCIYPPGVPRITNTQRQGTNVVFSFSTTNGIHYAIDYKEALTYNTWVPLTVQPGNGAAQSITNNLGAPSRFYRLRSL